MLIVNGTPHEHTTFGFLSYNTLFCELVNTTKEEAETIFKGRPKIIFVNADNLETDYTGMKLSGFLDEVAPGNTGVVLTK